QSLIAGKVHRGNHVGNAETSHDQRRLSIDHAVPHGSCLVVARIVPNQECALQTAFQIFDGFRFHPYPQCAPALSHWETAAPQRRVRATRPTPPSILANRGAGCPHPALARHLLPREKDSLLTTVID